MSKTLRLLTFSLGQLLAGRRLIIVGLLVALPLVLPAVFANGADVEPATFTLDLFRQLVLPVLLPVVALTFSTSSLGSELRDGTVTNLLLKPIPRPAVLGAKYLAAVLASLVVLLPAEAVGHVVAAGGIGSTQLLGGMLLATTVGVLAYCALGLLLSLLMARALLVGLAYALLWEGAVVSVPPRRRRCPSAGTPRACSPPSCVAAASAWRPGWARSAPRSWPPWSPWPPWSWPTAAWSGWTFPEGAGSIAASRSGRASRTATTIAHSSRPATAVTARSE